jgi:TatD DNase family protein
VIDSHCHLTDPKFKGEIDAVLGRAQDLGVTRFITIADSLEESVRSIALAERYPQIFCTVGVHPHNAKFWSNGDGRRLRELVVSSARVRAIGEIGLDYHYDFSQRDAQRKVFRTQLQIAKELCMPAVVHARESLDELMEIIEEVEPPKLVLHCCTERFSAVEPLLSRGYFISFSGIASYSNAGDVRETIQRCSLSQMMIETDSPYLAPVPFRGRRNEPAFVLEVAKIIAEVKGISLDMVDRVTSDNAMRFFEL